MAVDKWVFQSCFSVDTNEMGFFIKLDGAGSLSRSEYSLVYIIFIFTLNVFLHILKLMFLG